VLGSLPAIATIGIAPDNGLKAKLIWLIRCLGCPFTGLFYFCNVDDDPVAMCAYWLSSEYFIDDGNNNISYRPFGHYVKNIQAVQEQRDIMEDWIAEASVLDRLSSMVSVYYILVGIIAGISKATGPCMHNETYKDWPYIPLALIWTLPAVCIRIKKGRVVDKVLPRRLTGVIIVTNYNTSIINNKRAHTAITALASVTVPWIAVILAYYTRPVGFYCRSKYLTVMCSIWSFNSLVAYIFHLKGEREVSGHWIIHVWFCICGVIMTVLLTLLSLLANTRSWWVQMFGSYCYVSATCERA